jgi:hypothetical protein
MRWLYLLLLISSYSYSQNFVQTFVDRCTGEMKVITVPFEGSTVVVFYNKSRVFTAAEVRSGELQAWLEETYAWWENISPCSTNQAATTATQQATQNATSSTASTASTGTQSTNTENQTQNTEPPAQETKNESTTESTAETEQSTETETDSSENTEPEGESEDNGDDTSDGEESEEENEVEEEEQQEEEQKSEKKSKKRTPVVIAANYMAMQNLDRTYNNVFNVGFSQANYNGQSSYGASLLIWDNLKQFSASFNQSEMFYRMDNINRFKGVLNVSQGSVKRIRTYSANAIYLYGNIVASSGMSQTYLNKKGLVKGAAASLTYINANGVILTPSIVLFATKPYIINRIVVSPMLAAAFNPIMYIENEIIFNKHFTFIAGSNFDLPLSRNFRINVGSNITGNTAGIPLTYSFTIGSKFKF